MARLLFSWGAWVTTDWAFLITVSVMALELGGAAAVGLVGAVRVLPSALLSGVIAGLSDRLPRPVLLAFVHGSWCVIALGMAWIAVAEAPIVVLLIVIGIGSATSALLKPCQHSLLPQLVHSPSQLIIANSAYATIEGLGTVLGPALCALVLAGFGPPTVFVVLAAIYAAAAVMSGLIKTPFRPARRITPGAGQAGGRARDALEGLRMLSRPGTRTVWVLFMFQTTMRGFLNVFVILLATSGPNGNEARAGTLFAAIGVGGLVGAVAGLGGGARRSATAGFAFGIGLWGLPILIIGIWPQPGIAWVALAVLGLGNALEDIFGFSLFNRLFPDHVAGRAWGTYYSFHAATVALGSLAAPLLVAATSLSWAMVITGAVVMLAPVVLWRSLRAVGAMVSGRSEHVDLLQSVALFAPLSLIAIERLARSAQEGQAEPGTTIVREHDLGAEFYIVAEGELSVRQGDTEIRRLGPGDSFGEIALLEASPRTATVLAEQPSRLLTLDSDSFIAAVTGHRVTDDLARSRVSGYLIDDEARKGH